MLIKLRSLPKDLKLVLEQIPKHTHLMDVLRSGYSFLGCLETETGSHTASGYCQSPNCNFPSNTFYWYHFYKNNKRTDFYSAVCGAIGALRGPLHGGTNEEGL